MREPMYQTGIAAAVAGTGPQPRFEEQDRASQITARHLSATGNLITRCAWIFRRVSLTVLLSPQQANKGRMIFPTRTFEARRSSAATHVALGDDADQLEVYCILNHRPRSRSLNHASFARPLPPNLAAYSTKTLRLVSSLRCNDSFFSFFMICATIPSGVPHYSLVHWRLSSTQAEVLY